MQHSDLSKSFRVQAGTKFAEVCVQTRQALTNAICRTPHQLTDLQSGALPAGLSPLAPVRDRYNLGIIRSLSRITLSCAFVVQRTLTVQTNIAASAWADSRPIFLSKQALHATRAGCDQ